GTELYLSVDDEFRPLEKLTAHATPGNYRGRQRSFAHGTIDLLSFNDDCSEALIDDYKTGWSNTGITEYEAAHYAALVFAHFPTAMRVTFRWEFIRAKAASPAS